MSACIPCEQLSTWPTTGPGLTLTADQLPDPPPHIIPQNFSQRFCTNHRNGPRRDCRDGNPSGDGKLSPMQYSLVIMILYGTCLCIFCGNALDINPWQWMAKDVTENTQRKKKMQKSWNSRDNDSKVTHSEVQVPQNLLLKGMLNMTSEMAVQNWTLNQPNITNSSCSLWPSDAK